MKILTSVSATEDFSSVSYGLIDMTQEYAGNILEWMNKARELTQSIPSFNDLRIFDYSVDYFNYFEEFAELQNAGGSYIEELIDENDGTILLPPELEDSFEIPEYANTRSDADGIHVSAGSVYWQAFGKHTSMSFYTRSISREWIEKLAKGETP
jgi:hypothetical protein